MPLLSISAGLFWGGGVGGREMDLAKIELQIGHEIEFSTVKFREIHSKSNLYLYQIQKKKKCITIPYQLLNHK